MSTIPLRLMTLSVFLLFFISQVAADNNEGWRTFNGAWFRVEYPAKFTVQPSMKSRTRVDGYDSAFFTTADGEAEFYVFSPQWNGEPKDVAINPVKEEYAAEKETQEGDKRIRWVTIRAKDKSYLRSYVDTEDTRLNTRLVFGFKYKDRGAYDHYRDSYLKFVRSLKQYAD